MYQKQTRNVYSEQATFTVVTYVFTSREIYSNHQEQTNQYKTKRNEAKRSKAKPSNIIESETSSYLTRLQQTENHPELPENKTNQDIQDAE